MKLTNFILILSAIVLGLAGTSCTKPGKKTAVGAGVGAAAGAAVGAIVGHQSGERGKGALIGAGVGAVIGGGAGNYLDKQAKELEEVAETKRTENGIITKLKGDILFPSGQSTLRGPALTNINKISDIVKKYPENKMTIVGHTDSTGSDTLNQTLSEQRAQAVKMQMVNRGVPSNAIQVVGMGESQPIANNDTPSGRSQNRRVELQITVDQSQQQQ